VTLKEKAMENAATPLENLQVVAQLLNLNALEPLDLLRGFAAIINELRSRGIMRTKNNPVADYAEWLVSRKLDLRLEDNSRLGHDAIAPDGTRYEIKGRRVKPDDKSVQLSAIRNLDEHCFDYLIGVIFEVDFSIRYAAKVPHEVVVERATYRRHTNAHVLHLSDRILEDERVEDITKILAA
jgi:hypothetical protein